MSSDLRPEVQEVVDDVKAIIAPFKQRIEALEAEVAALSTQRDGARECWDEEMARADKAEAEAAKAKSDYQAMRSWADELHGKVTASEAEAARLREALVRAKPYVANSVHLAADMKLIAEALGYDEPLRSAIKGEEG